MPKKSSKKSTQVAERPVVEDEKKPSTIPKKSADEIDEIFAGKKRKNPDNGKAKKAAEDVEASKQDDKLKKSRKKKDGKNSVAYKENGNDFAQPPSRSRKRTGDGLTIYTEEELGIGKADAGGTPLCPFDCECCF